jgi:hypothetical protein
MLLVAAFAFTAVFALAGIVLAETLLAGRHKIVAALAGRSPAAEPVMVTRPVRVRIASRRVSRPVTAQPRLAAAA